MVAELEGVFVSVADAVAEARKMVWGTRSVAECQDAGMRPIVDINIRGRRWRLQFDSFGRVLSKERIESAQGT